MASIPTITPTQECFTIINIYGKTCLVFYTSWKHNTHHIRIRILFGILLFHSHPDVPLLDEKDVYVAFMPFFHIYGIMAVMNLSLTGGCTTVVLPRFDLEEYLSTVQKYKVTSSDTFIRIHTHSLKNSIV